VCVRERERDDTVIAEIIAVSPGEGSEHRRLTVRVRVCVCVCLYVCVREIKSDDMVNVTRYTPISLWLVHWEVRASSAHCVCVREREGERARVFVFVCVCVCLCACV